MRDIFVVTSGKGGVGKTSIVSLLAKSLCDSKYKVLIIDADLGLKNVDLVLRFNIRAKYDISDVIKGRCELQDAIEHDEKFPNLDLLPLCLKSDVRHFPEIFLDQVIKELKKEYDYILIDSPAGIENGFYLAIKHATHAIVVVNDEECSLHDSALVIKILKGQPYLKISGILNRTKLKRSALKRRVEEIEERLQIDNIAVLSENNLETLLFNNKNKVKNITDRLLANVIKI